MFEKIFNLKLHGANMRSEAIGGLTSFLATFYIIVVNPAILSNAGLPVQASITSTIMIAAFSTILMGLYANVPIILAPGMGLNAFFAFSVVLGQKVPWQTALGIVFWAGLFFIILSIFNIRGKIVDSIPKNLRFAISSGIGLFITFIGLMNAGLISKHPATLLSMSTLEAKHYIFFLGLFITAALTYKKVTGHLVLGIIITLVLAIPLGRGIGSETLVVWKGFAGTPDFSLFFQMDLKNSMTLSLIPVILAFVFTDLFDTLSTLVGVSEAGDLLDKQGRPRNLEKSLLVDAIATTTSAFVGTSPTTSYVESAAGVEAGAKTGLSSVIAGMLFLPFLFLAPLISMVPSFSTAPVLVIVGLFMIKPITKIEWQKFDEALPSFLALILIPLTFSITKGIVVGFISYCFIKIFVGKLNEVHKHFLILNLILLLSSLFL